MSCKTCMTKPVDKSNITGQINRGKKVKINNNVVTERPINPKVVQRYGNTKIKYG